ncbi:FAD binding domain-containing protein [Halobacteria archaeon AArc-m2/3/4]|uniref:FAD binding domain-containing protein n=1 Tax=Natronoglomus mannanivorans TaxID=2979990 RepID=A0ABT2Q8E1_9EURY|nr:FAD binding domain-containing protein [Halobacteria archaeon AArc-m2/3/4]
MFPPHFDYHRASSIDDALDVLERHRDDDPRILAGGHSLLPDLKNGRASPDVLVDIGEIDGLRGIESGVDVESDTDHGTGQTAIGALTTYADVLESDHLERHAPVLTDATRVLADLQIRNRGTVGGNLTAAEPGADLPAAALAADATIHVRGPDGERTIDAGEFLGADGSESALGERELVTEIRVPPSPTGGYAKKTHPASGYAMVGVAAVLEIDTETIADARVAATGVLEHAVRLTAVEDALVGERVDEAIETAAERAGETIDPADARSDDHASGEFRVHLLSTYAAQALERAMEVDA